MTYIDCTCHPYELKLCKEHGTMTNHIGDKCMKCDPTADIKPSDAVWYHIMYAPESNEDRVKYWEFIKGDVEKLFTNDCMHHVDYLNGIADCEVCGKRVSKCCNSKLKEGSHSGDVCSKCDKWTSACTQCNKPLGDISVMSPSLDPKKRERCRNCAGGNMRLVPHQNGGDQ